MPDIYEELHDCAGGEEPLTQIERKELGGVHQPVPGGVRP